MSVRLGFAIVALAAFPAMASDSENCPKEGQALLVSGSYSGDFSHISLFKGGRKQMYQQWMLWLRGTFTLTVDTAGTVTDAAGTLQYYLGGGGKSKEGERDVVVVSGLSAEASGPLKLHSQTPTSFKLSAKVSGSADVFAYSKDREEQKGEARHGGGVSEEVVLDFSLADARCGSTHGDFFSEVISGTVSKLGGQGFTVDAGSSKWSMTGGDVERIRKELDEFRRKVDEAVTWRAQGIEPRRGVASKLERLRQDMEAKHGTDGLYRCYSAVWRGGAKRAVSAWLGEDLPPLAAYQGDDVGLTEKVLRVKEADNQLAVLGVDTCDDALHQRAWRAVDSAVKNAIARARRDQKPGRLIEFAKQASLGQVAPRLESEVLVAVGQIATDWTRDEIRSMNTLPDEPFYCNPALEAAVVRVLIAAKQAQLVGASDAADEAFDAIRAKLERCTSTIDKVAECAHGENRSLINAMQKSLGAGPHRR